MNEFRLPDYLDHIRQAAREAITYVEGWEQPQFLADKRTQDAIVMNLLVIGEATTRIMEHYPEFVVEHPEIQWRQMRTMRNRIAHGYFDIDLNIVWDTVQQGLPELLRLLPSFEQ